MASLLQRDSTRLFLKLLRMFQNAIAALGTQPADVPYAITGGRSEYYNNKTYTYFYFLAAISNADERIAMQR